MAIENEDIEDLAKAPQRTRTDEGVVEERAISELIEADRYTATKSVTRPPYGMSIARTKPGGTV